MPAGDHSDIHDDLMRFKPDGMTPNGWATKAGVSRTVWSDMRRHGNPSRRTLEKLLAAAGSSLAEFEALRIGEGARAEAGAKLGLSDRKRNWGAAQLPPLPLLETMMAGRWDDPAKGIELIELRTAEVKDRLPRPASLAGDPGAYALAIVGDSMWPRFRPGRRLAVSTIAPILIGDDVVVKLKRGTDSGEGATMLPVLIKELVRKSSSGVELRQFNPDVTFHVSASEIAGIDKVLGELI